MNGSSNGSSSGFSTPIKNKNIEALKAENGSKSPSLQIPATPLMKQLGYGTGVGVYLLERSPSRSPWAIKKLVKMEKPRKLYENRLSHEASILRQLNHPNIIGFRMYTSIDTKPALAMEKASRCLGDLIEEKMDEAFNKDPSSAFYEPVPYPAHIIEKICLDVSKALDYLHTEKKYVHCDLKSGNILIFGDFDTIKICDFGVARKIKESGEIEGSYVGTEIWHPMEVVLMNRGEKRWPITSKADIYPLGLSIHELISLKTPHFNTLDNDSTKTCTDTDESTFDELAFDEMLAKVIGTRPPLPDIELDKTYTLILGLFYICTEEDPNKRPTAKEIVQILTNDNDDKSPATTTTAT